MAYQRLLIAALVTTAGCVSPGAPFPMLGDRGLLAGRWEGAYHSTQTGRSGSILFRFGPGTDSAYGSVLMTPARQESPLSAVSPTSPSPSGAARVLRITYVWCGGGEVTGRLDPYDDPVTGERIYTMFDGRLSGEVLSGSFSTLYPDRSRLLMGTWSVRREKP